MAEYLCPGVGCDEWIVDAATWFDETGRYVGRTCAHCEARWLDRLTEWELADLARDPFLSGSMLRQLLRRGSAHVDAALASRGRRALPPSIADGLRVTSLVPTARLEPFWPRYRSDEGATSVGVVDAELIDIEPLEGDEMDAELVGAPLRHWPSGHLAGSVVRHRRRLASSM